MDPVPSAMDPRTTYDLVGLDAAEQTLLDGWASERLHHAWMITGPRGVGKATLAHRFARFLLAHQKPERGGGLFDDAPVLPDNLYVPPDHPVSRRIAAEAHGDLRVLSQGVDPRTGRERNEIVIGDVRALNDFFAKTSAEGGWRVAIIDSADALNRNAANALLKTLEEPPARSILLLVAHRPGRVLATIRSRCRQLSVKPLDHQTVSTFLADRLPDLAEEDRHVLAALAEGSPGRALQLAQADGLTLYRDLISLIDKLPDLPPRAVLALGDAVAGKGRDGGFALFSELLTGILVRLVRNMANPGLGGVPGEAEILQRLGGMSDLDRWIEVWEKSSELNRQCEALNLDRRQMVVTMLNGLASAARGVSA
ncbi:MAG: DNA polymerase III subunit delta' [Alphaproteobacteria bacterium]|nr:MAG: DNA polymerase III subunit delta' [Alphaproteobacteria bacterium]